MSSQGRFAIQSNEILGLGGPNWTYHNGLIVTGEGDDKAHVLQPPEELREALNKEIVDFCFDSTGNIFGVVTNIEKTISFWDYHSGHLLKKVEIPYPMRIALSKDKKYFIITTYVGLRYISIATLSWEPKLNRFDQEFRSLILHQKVTLTHKSKIS